MTYPVLHRLRKVAQCPKSLFLKWVVITKRIEVNYHRLKSRMVNGVLFDSIQKHNGLLIFQAATENKFII